MFAVGAKQKLAAYKVGLVTPVTVSEMTEHGALCQLPNGVKGFCTQEHMSGKPSIYIVNISESLILT